MTLRFDSLMPLSKTISAETTELVSVFIVLFPFGIDVPIIIYFIYFTKRTGYGRQTVTLDAVEIIRKTAISKIYLPSQEVISSKYLSLRIILGVAARPERARTGRRFHPGYGAPHGVFLVAVRNDGENQIVPLILC